MGSAVQEMMRILQGMRARGVRSVWLSDVNLHAFTAIPGQFSPKAQPAPAPQIQPTIPQQQIQQAPRPPIQRPQFTPSVALKTPPPPIPPIQAAGTTIPEHKPQPIAPSALPNDFVQKISGMSWDELRSSVETCKYCTYSATSQRHIFYTGVAKPAVLFIGDFPMAEEMNNESPFTSPAGQMLYKMAQAMGLSWEEADGSKPGAALVNVLKCRPPSMPSENAISTCSSYLRRQVDLVSPSALVLLGAIPLKALGIPGTFSQMEGKMQSYNNIPAMPIKHPNMIMRFNQQQTIFVAERKKAWLALQEVMKLLH